MKPYTKTKFARLEREYKISARESKPVFTDARKAFLFVSSIALVGLFIAVLFLSIALPDGRAIVADWVSENIGKILCVFLMFLFAVFTLDGLARRVEKENGN